jgi:hypothetical protein
MGNREGIPNKHHNGRTQDATAANKARYIKALAKGMQPALAAERCHLGYSTVYDWKNNDPEFAKAWIEAIELGLDKLEFETYSSSIPSDRQFILKARRREVFGTQYDEQQRINGNAPLQIPDQEHRQRLERLGLLIEMREGDYEEVDVDVSPRAGTEPPSGSDSSSG